MLFDDEPVGGATDGGVTPTPAPSEDNGGEASPDEGGEAM